MNTLPTTPEAQIDYIATKIMGWKKVANAWGHWRTTHDGLNTIFEDETWNPLTDWNHWRQVEEKLMEDEAFWEEIERYFDDHPTSRVGPWGYIEADLPTRVSALIQAHSQLNP